MPSLGHLTLLVLAQQLAITLHVDMHGQCYSSIQTNTDSHKMRMKDREVIVFLFDH